MRRLIRSLGKGGIKNFLLAKASAIAKNSVHTFRTSGWRMVPGTPFGWRDCMQVCARWIVSAAMFAAAVSPASAGTAPSDSVAGWSESGQATWYGPRHEGRRTSSGERFDPKKLTAAHASLPLGSWVRVTVENTGASIVVRVNDREPPHGVRCIDLSHEAAARLGIVRSGVADVTLARVSGPDEVEVAEAPDSARPVEAVSSPHGRPHKHRARR